jgi:hypothetical protein
LKKSKAKPRDTEKKTKKREGKKKVDRMRKKTPDDEPEDEAGSELDKPIPKKRSRGKAADMQDEAQRPWMERKKEHGVRKNLVK